jgi:TrmH family RNA methyltransferase
VDACGNSEVLQVPDAIFRELSGGGTPVGILAVVPVPEFPAEGVEGSCVLLDGVQDAGNVGTILRTAAAAGIRDVALGVGCAGAWTPRVLRAGQGAHFSLRIREQVDLMCFLTTYRGTSVAAVANGGQPLFEADLTGEVAWIFGNEGAGIDEELARSANQRVTVPLANGTESLNVSAAAAICLFEVVRRRRAREGAW